MFFSQVNIVIHSLSGGKDAIIYIQSNHSLKYDVGLPRIDLIWSLDKDGFGHCSVLNYQRSKFKATIGWHCVICNKLQLAHSYKHSCRKGNIKPCLRCHRLEMEDLSKYCIYHSTWDQFCDSKHGKQFHQCCTSCNHLFTTEDCFRFHKQVN